MLEVDAVNESKKDAFVFLNIGFAHIRETQKIDESTWPASDQLDKSRTLVTTPDPLFIYVANPCRFSKPKSKKSKRPVRALPRA